MKKFGAFLSETTIRGLLVVLPVLLLWAVFTQAFSMAKKIATPVVHVMPHQWVADTATNQETAAVVVLVLGAFLLGLLLRARLMRRGLRWLEGHTLDHIPGYAVLRGAVSETMQPQSAGGFHPALLTIGDGLQRPAYVVEDHGDGNLTVFLPGAPAPFAGMIYIVSRDRIVYLDASLGELAMSIAQFGAGLGALARRARPVDETTPSS